MINRSSFFVLIIFITATMSACSPKMAVITQWNSEKIAIDSTMDRIADSGYIAHLMPFKISLESEMGKVIGESAQHMRVHKPESLLSNLVADVYRTEASEILGFEVDVAVTNMGGIRSELPKGEITVRKIFELMPFENELVVLWLKGDQLLELLHFFASIKGQGVSGLRMEIKDGQAINVLIGNQPIEAEKTYSIATNDYLAGGNDGMIQLARAQKMQTTGLKVREIFLDYVKKQTMLGKPLQSSLDGRITLINSL